MNTQVFNSYDSMCQCVAEEIIQNLKENPHQLLCIAAGHTSLGVFRHLIEAYHSGHADFSKAGFIAMDEWLHMTADTRESCGYFIYENFLKYVNYSQENVRLWDGSASDPEGECKAVESFIQQKSLRKSIDFLVLGAGMNGHLALNEPGTAFDSRAHVTNLDPVTQKVGQKYFSHEASLTGGITLGIENFREAARTILMINGTAKHDILLKILNAPEPTPQLPATALYTFNNASLYFDEEALNGNI